jgi:uncharacterized protein YkwD
MKKIFIEKLKRIFIYPFKYIPSLFNSRRWQVLFKGEAQEVKELSTGQENFSRFYKDSSRLLKDFFIPHEGNNFRPHSLRPKNLVFYSALAITAKILITLILFLNYPSPAQLSTIISSNMLDLINQSRAEDNAQPLKENLLLDKFAQQKANDMVAKNYFAHDTPDGKKPWQWIDRKEYDYVYAGENLAMDFVTAESVHEAFMKSPSHRRNILNSKYKEVGIAVVHGKLNNHSTILLVELFGTQRKDMSTLVQVDNKKEPTAQVANKPATVLAESISNQDNPSQGLNLITEKEKLAETTKIKANIDSPNKDIITVTPSAAQELSLTELLVEYSNIFFIALLIFLVAALVLNILIKINIQHPTLILQSLAVIALLLATVLIKFNFIEQITEKIIIL